MESPINVLIVLSVITLFIAAASNVWKRGVWGIALIFISGVIPFICVLISSYMEKGHIGTKPLAITSWLYLAIVYFFGVKYVMKTSFFELESHEKYKNYLKDNKINGLFPLFISYLGPVLFFSALGVLIVDIVRRFL